MTCYSSRISLLLLIMALVLCRFATGCITSEEPEETPPVTVSDTLLDFGKELESLHFTVTAKKDTEWKLNDSKLPSWCTAEIVLMKTGTRVVVHADRSHLLPGEYSASLFIEWGSESHTVDIYMIVPESDQDTGTVLIDIPVPEIEEKSR